MYADQKGIPCIKTTVLPLKSFLGHVKDQMPQKKATQSTFGLIGLGKILESKLHATSNEKKNDIAYHFLNNAVFNDHTLSAVAGREYLHDGYKS